ncbi:hypothetical protein [Pseudonocardia sp. ICBG1293]|uniref:hypothetical protein n=1 Tax=Pseudonocardia sp. ICBG1293 TaxID=2844382 RepID=UPI001CCDBE86|nr:hypothetical protein [Pseudonocardia sp. ICBG1293]
MAEGDIPLDVHVALVDQLPHRLTAAVAAGVVDPAEARELVLRARLVLQARIATDGVREAGGRGGPGRRGIHPIG